MKWLVMVEAVAVVDTAEADGDVEEADVADTVDPTQHLWAAAAVGKNNGFPWILTNRFRRRIPAMDRRGLFSIQALAFKRVLVSV